MTRPFNYDDLSQNTIEQLEDMHASYMREGDNFIRVYGSSYGRYEKAKEFKAELDRRRNEPSGQEAAMPSEQPRVEELEREVARLQQVIRHHEATIKMNGEQTMLLVGMVEKERDEWKKQATWLMHTLSGIAQQGGKGEG